MYCRRKDALKNIYITMIIIISLQRSDCQSISRVLQSDGWIEMNTFRI